MGTSGGVWGLERGYCLMIGGETPIVQHLDPIFKTLAPGAATFERTPGREKIGGTAEDGYLHCGPDGAGHFVKMVHNGIEYGMMAAYAEGLNILQGTPIVGKRKQRNRRRDDSAARAGTLSVSTSMSRDVAEVWRRGSVVASWLLDLTAAALVQDQRTEQIRRPRFRFGRRTLDHRRRDRRRPFRSRCFRPLCIERFASRGEADYQDKLLSAMRFQFGGHIEKPVGCR